MNHVVEILNARTRLASSYLPDYKWLRGARSPAYTAIISADEIEKCAIVGKSHPDSSIHALLLRHLEEILHTVDDINDLLSDCDIAIVVKDHRTLGILLSYGLDANFSVTEKLFSVYTNTYSEPIVATAAHHFEVYSVLTLLAQGAKMTIGFKNFVVNVLSKKNSILKEHAMWVVVYFNAVKQTLQDCGCSKDLAQDITQFMFSEETIVDFIDLIPKRQLFSDD